MHVMHVLDHSIPLQSGYTFRTRAILQEQRKRGWETCHLTGPKHNAGQSARLPGHSPSCDRYGPTTGGPLQGRRFRRRFRIYHSILYLDNQTFLNIATLHMAGTLCGIQKNSRAWIMTEKK